MSDQNPYPRDIRDSQIPVGCPTPPLPPSGLTLIGELEEEMFLLSQKGDIIVQGDYNARTGDIQETVLEDDSTFLNVPEDYENA